jgi:serine/threonine protein kinase
MAGLVGSRLGAYELLELIGEGGMAEVYRARQSTAFGREVAIKVIRPEDNQQSSFRTRFLREAEAISRLSHPNILPLIEAGEAQDTLYLVMPLVREGTLLDLMKQHNGPLPLETALALFSQLCAAVHYAHSQGIIHRDIKPQNVLLQQGTHVLLGDFGIARDNTQSHITSTGVGMGSAAYMAPDQVIGEATARSDIYSLGVVLYEMITGRLPYEGATSLEIIVKHSSAPIPDPRVINPQVPAALALLIQTALAKSPQERFQSAIALGRAVQESTGGARSPSLPSWPPAPPVAQQAPATTPPVPAGPTSVPIAPTSTAAIDAYRTRVDPKETQLASQPTRQGFAGPPTYIPPGAAGFSPMPAGAASFPPTAGVTPAPPSAGPRRKKRSWLIFSGVLVAVLLLAGGGVFLSRWFFAGSAGVANTPTATPSSLLSFTNSDQTFKISYPRGWTQQPPSTGTGVEFDGPGDASFTVANQGDILSDAGSAVDLFCTLIAGSAGAQQSIMVSGQRWVQETCGTSPDGFQVVVEVAVYKGSLFMIVYQARPGDFASAQATYFAPMEQSFTFLN